VDHTGQADVGIEAELARHAAAGAEIRIALGMLEVQDADRRSRRQRGVVARIGRDFGGHGAHGGRRQQKLAAEYARHWRVMGSAFVSPRYRYFAQNG
jgi:hypothetical protein